MAQDDAPGLSPHHSTPSVQVTVSRGGNTSPVILMPGLPAFISPLPRSFIFGLGAIKRIGSEAAQFGRSAMLVMGGSSLARSGNLRRIEDSLRAAGVKWAAFPGVPAEPTLDWVDKGRRYLRDTRAEVVLGVGGGSVLDVAKAIAFLAHEDAPTAAYHRGERDPASAGLPSICAPTTSGTGAEVTPNSVLTDTERGVKASLRGGDLTPAVALVDPELTLSCPRPQTAYSGLDAIVQALESYTSTGANPYSDALALRAFELMAPALPAAVEDGGNLEAREAMALGSVMAGLALACARLGLVHGLAHPLGHLCSLPHGLICGLLMPHVMQFNLPVAGPKYAVAARAISLPNGSDEKAAGALVDWIHDLLEELGVARPLGECGLREADYPRIIDEALASGSTKHNARSVTADDLRSLLRSIATGKTP